VTAPRHIRIDRAEKLESHPCSTELVSVGAIEVPRGEDENGRI
jgi:hypothetical protein